MYAPPPPIQQKPFPWKPILLILALCALVVTALCAVGGFWVYRTASESPKARPGFGKPTVEAKLANGWIRYRLPEIPLTIESPYPLKPESLTYRPGDGLITKNWIYYETSTDWNGISIIGEWFHNKREFHLDEEIDYVEDWLRDSYSARNVVTESDTSEVAYLNAYTIKGTYTADGYKMGFLALIWEREKSSFTILLTHYAEYEKQASKEARRILQSVKER